MSDREKKTFNFIRSGWFLWIVAVIITLSSAVYQRLTGPTYPVRGKVTVGNHKLTFKLLRSETVETNALVRFQVSDTTLNGYVKYRRYKSHDDWTILPLERQDGQLRADLPSQPAAGKIIYYVFVKSGEQVVSLTGDQPVILRYKGFVPLTILIPHVIVMFMAMLLSNRSALAALNSSGKAKKYMLWTIGLFFIGGFILGPAVQKYAFDALWTGFPFGFDLTDNKTLIGMIGWLWAWYKNRGNHRAPGWIIFAAVLLLAVYLIPHSVLGSEIDHTQSTVTP